MSNLTGKGLADFAISKLGTPYVYGAKGANGTFTQAKLDMLVGMYPDVFTDTYIKKAKKFVGKVCCDCSGLISWYTGKVLGSSQLCHSAKEKKEINKNDLSDIPVGSVLWKSGHVGVYVGDGYCVEARGIDYGCVKTKVKDRTFTHYLLFDYIDYSTEELLQAREENPYTIPSRTIKYDSKNKKIICTGNDVKWVQFELVQAGYEIEIDGKFGPASHKALGSFQQSAKLEKDYKCGPLTRKALLAE